MNARSPIRLFPAVAEFLETRRGEFDRIPSARRAELETLADHVRGRSRDGVRLTFICTHNSRRSHLSQIWAKIAADRLRVSNVETFSGGTEATAMNPRVVASLRRAGLRIEAPDEASSNPHYAVSYSDDVPPLICFSKVYDSPPNPTSGYAAIMTCSSADQACPIVPGCELRLPIRYEDPKIADDSPDEAAVYDERSAQIAREMLYAMSRV